MRQFFIIVYPLCPFAVELNKLACVLEVIMYVYELFMQLKSVWIYDS
jgi:hypothetical protein